MALPMEFWGVEVKAGQPLKVNPGNGKILHLSQASLGESKNSKANDSVPISVNFDGKKLVLGTLSPDLFPQLAFDLVFEKDFELSHNWKHGSIFFCGYTTVVQGEDDDLSEDDSDEEDLPLNVENGKGASEAPAKASTANANAAKPGSSAKPKVTIVEPVKAEAEDSDEDDEDDDDDDEEGSDDSDADSDEEDSEEEETPKAEQGKKRPAESAPKTPIPDKKAKVTTPQKTDGKKVVHIATPHPSKHAGKTPANVKHQTPKSDAKVSCKSCNKFFNSENALQSHSKAKHGAK